jgi:hypothetical protein
MHACFQLPFFSGIKYYCGAFGIVNAKLFLYNWREYANCNHQFQHFKEVTHENDYQRNPV